MGQGGKLRGATTRELIPASGYLLRQCRGGRWGWVDDVLELMEQLDVATFAHREESQEADRLCLSVATAKWETAVMELAAAEAQAHLASKAFDTI
jgi:hypothetical protein